MVMIPNTSSTCSRQHVSPIRLRTLSTEIGNYPGLRSSDSASNCWISPFHLFLKPSCLSSMPYTPRDTSMTWLLKIVYSRTVFWIKAHQGIKAPPLTPLIPSPRLYPLESETSQTTIRRCRLWTTLGRLSAKTNPTWKPGMKAVLLNLWRA